MKKNVKKDSPRIKELKYKARRHCIKEGLFETAKGSFGDYYISPFAIAINASNSLVALLSSIAGLLGPLSQIGGSRLIEKYPRKKIILKTVFLESLMWIPILVLAILFYKGILVEILPFLLLILFSLYVIFNNLGYPAWFSWIGDIVNEKYRGRWFSKRNLLMGFVSVILAITASFFLDYFKENNWTMQGFIILFFLAFVSRIMSWKTFKRQYEPKLKLKKSYYFSFLDFIINAPKNNFGKFTIFRGFLSFASSISAPFIVVYLLRFLEFNYSTYMIITFSGTVFSLGVISLWGKFTDKYGNYRALYITSLIVPVIPLLWIFNASPIYLIFVPSLVSGISWVGFNLGTRNFIYDNVGPQKRSIAVSYFNMVNGIGIFLGAGLGALLIKVLPTEILKSLTIIFILSAIARIIVALVFLPRIKEIRKTKKFYGPEVFKNLILKQAKPTLYEEAHEIMSIKEYLFLK